MNSRPSFFPPGHEYVSFPHGKQGGVLTRGHTNVRPLLHNRNRLPVIVRQNRNRQWGSTGRVSCHSALLRNYRICMYVGTQTTMPVLNPECTTRHGFEAIDAASISLMITIADTVPVSRCYVTIGSYRRRIRRCSPAFCRCKGIVAVFADWHTVQIREINTVHRSLFFFTRRYDHNCFTIIIANTYYNCEYVGCCYQSPKIDSTLAKLLSRVIMTLCNIIHTRY